MHHFTPSLRRCRRRRLRTFLLRSHSVRHALTHSLALGIIGGGGGALCFVLELGGVRGARVHLNEPPALLVEEKRKGG